MRSIGQNTSELCSAKSILACILSEVHMQVSTILKLQLPVSDRNDLWTAFDRFFRFSRKL